MNTDIDNTSVYQIVTTNKSNKYLFEMVDDFFLEKHDIFFPLIGQTNLKVKLIFIPCVDF